MRSFRAILDEPKGSRPLPTHLQPSPQFLVGDVQVTLRLLHAGVAEHQLDDADADAVCEQTRSSLVTQVMPVQVDLPELLAVPNDAI